MFNLTDYEIFLRSKVIGRATYKKEDITEKLIRALLQFDMTPGAYLGINNNIPNSRASEKYREIFDLSNKNNQTALNTWFLYIYGYKNCKSCNTVQSLEFFGNHKNSYNNKAFYCKLCYNHKSKEWISANKDKRAMVIKEYARRNPEIIKKTAKKYRLSNLDKDAAKTAKRRAAKLKATPMWLTDQQLKDIKSFYSLAKKLESICGVKYHVDHITPLRGENVCGLHVPCNLQVLEASLNISKSNNTNIDYITKLKDKPCRKYTVNDRT